MIEEAAGIRMYEAKREVCIKLLKKKEEKISEFNSVCMYTFFANIFLNLQFICS